MVDWKIAAIAFAALICSIIAYRSVGAPKAQSGMIVLNWRWLAKGLAGGAAFVVALLGGLALDTLVN